jgi:hypothetical protein
MPIVVYGIPSVGLPSSLSATLKILSAFHLPDMRRPAHFTLHAFDRTRQRTSLTCEEIGDILDGRRFVNIGSKPGLHRNHLLFYSARDQAYYVAIQDSLTGTIVTILPSDYHASLAWPISQLHFETAAALATSDTKPIRHAADSTASVFIVSGCFLDEENNPKVKTLLTLRAQPYDHQICNVLSDSTLIPDLKDSCRRRGIPFKRLDAILIRKGKKDKSPLRIDLQYGEFEALTVPYT